MLYLWFMLMMQVRVKRTLWHLSPSAWFMSGKLNWPAKLVPFKQVLLFSISIYCVVKLFFMFSFGPSVPQSLFEVLEWSADFQWRILLCHRSVLCTGKEFSPRLCMHAQESYASEHVCQHGELHGVQDTVGRFHLVKQTELQSLFGGAIATDRIEEVRPFRDL